MINNNPIISIIVPVYNVEKYLKRCIDSILNQTFKDFELILVDDGSTDVSGSICDEYLNIDNRVKVIHKKNEGQGEARNFGIEYSMGEYIGFIDSDDYISNDMYETLYNLCIENNADISICNSYRDFNGSLQLKFNEYPKEVLSKEQAISELINYKKFGNSVCDKLYSKKVFNNIRFPKCRAYEDNFVLYKLLNKADKIVYEGTPKYYHYYRENSTTTIGLRKETVYYYKSKKQIYIDLKDKYPNFKSILFKQYYWSVWEILYEILKENKELELRNEYDDIINELRQIKIPPNTLNYKERLRLQIFRKFNKLYINNLKKIYFEKFSRNLE